MYYVSLIVSILMIYYTCTFSKSIFLRQINVTDNKNNILVLKLITTRTFYNFDDVRRLMYLKYVYFHDSI